MRVAIIENGIVINVCEASDDWASAHGGILAWSAGPGWRYDGQEFLPPIQSLDEFKIAATATIESAYAVAIGVIADKYPATERDSWAKQEMEARAYVANAAAPTPILTAIAAERGMTVADLAASVIIKADSYALYAGAQIGRRRARLDAIAAATTIADLELIVW